MRVNGIRVKRYVWDQSSEDMAREIIKKLRPIIRARDGEYKGTRFNDSKFLVDALRSCVPQHAFKTQPFTAVTEALIYAMGCDHHYAFEKSYE